MEVNYNGEWGTVCDDGWDYRDAYVVCRQLGFGSSGRSYSSAYFGQGTGPIWLDNVMCTSTEPTLASCGHLGFNITRSCSHREDAGVKCYGTQGKPNYLLFTTNKIANYFFFVKVAYTQSFHFIKVLSCYIGSY